MKKLKHFLSVLLLLSVVCSSVFSEQSYIITESELLQLEKNTQEQKAQIEILQTQLQTLKAEHQNLTMLQNQMKTYCDELENEKKIIKTISISSVAIFFVGGCFLGYKLAKE